MTSAERYLDNSKATTGEHANREVQRAQAKALIKIGEELEKLNQNLNGGDELE